MGNNDTSINPLVQLVGIPHVIIYIKRVSEETYAILTKCGLLAELAEGYYAVTPECLDELKAKRIHYIEIARHPIPKNVRFEIRAELKKNGVMAPI